MTSYPHPWRVVPNSKYRHAIAFVEHELEALRAREGMLQDLHKLLIEAQDVEQEALKHVPPGN